MLCLKFTITNKFNAYGKLYSARKTPKLSGMPVAKKKKKKEKKVTWQFLDLTKAMLYYSKLTITNVNFSFCFMVF